MFPKLLMACVILLTGGISSQDASLMPPVYGGTQGQGKSPKTTKPAAEKTTQEPAEEIMNNASVIELLKAGLSEDLITAKIRSSKYRFDLSTKGMISLKQAGASDRLLGFLMDPANPVETKADNAQPPAGLPGSFSTLGAASKIPAKTGSTGGEIVPQEAGMYYSKGAELVRMDLRTLASAKTAGRLGSVATLGIKSVKSNAYLLGAAAKVKVNGFSPVFYFRLPEGLSIDEVVLVEFYPKDDRREVEVGSKSGVVGSKQGLRMEAIRPFESQELGPRFYKIAAAKLQKGEYLFYLIGSADSVRGIQGKGYDFSVD
jgi:hypothetical protein